MSEQVETPHIEDQGEQVGGADEPAGTAMPTSAADLAAVLEGRSDEEIESFIKGQGYDAVLGQIFSEMQGRFLPEKTGGRSAVIQYDITTADATETYQVVVADATCKTGKGSGEEPTVTLVLSLPNFLRLISGKLNGVQAFMSGKLKIRGDMMLAQSMQGWFDQS